MRLTLHKSLAFVVILVSSHLFISPFATGQDKWDVADSNIKRLSPAAFPRLPGTIVSYLQKKRCTISQNYNDPKPHNVIRGQFARKGQYDWAVLCSKNRVSSILVFWNGSARRPSEIAKSADKIFLQGTGEPDGIGFSRVIAVVGKKYILDHYKAYGGPRPPTITHQGIDDGFMEKASMVLYYYRGRWRKLQGAD